MLGSVNSLFLLLPFCEGGGDKLYSKQASISLSILIIKKKVFHRECFPDSAKAMFILECNQFLINFHITKLFY